MGLLTLSGGRCQCFPLLPSSATAITISQRCGEELITHSLTVELTASSRGLGGSRDANGAYVHCTELSISMKMISSTIHLAGSAARPAPAASILASSARMASPPARCCGATDARERRSCT